ncbi:hypothetical protein LRHP344_01329 [Lacticaseibacillus rhamnosus]|nr:hypothetical protein LRHP344_01329 [Lacticaseibacillus rhamnosus]
MQHKTLAMKWLFLGSLITNTGISLIWPLTTIYMHEYLGESLTVAGIVLFLNSMFMVIGNSLGAGCLTIGNRMERYWRVFV